MDISRHKGPAYDREDTNSEAVMELSASRRNLMLDNSGSDRGSSMKGKSFKREKPVEKSDSDNAADKPEDKPAEAAESKV